MKRFLKYALLVGVLLLLFGCSPEYQEAATTVPREPARVNQPEPVRPEPEPDIPMVYGDDPYFDRLWDECEAGDSDACDELYWESPIGSDYEQYALDRIDELENQLSDRDVVDALGADFILDLTWDTLSRQEQSDLCGGVVLFGANVAGALLAEGSDGLLTAEEAASWLARKCL
jgi:hypothetical protein